MNSKITELLKLIKDNTKKNCPINKRRWYKVGKYLANGGKIPKYNKENSKSARRTYYYYREGKGDWEGPSPRMLGKMVQKQFREVLKGREQAKREILLETEILEDYEHVTENENLILPDWTQEEVQLEEEVPQENTQWVID